MEVSDKRKLFFLLGIIFSFLLILAAITIATQRTSISGRASSRGNISSVRSLSLENSYLFASPLQSLADGSSVIRVTVFLIDNQGLGISGQKVQIKSSGNLKIVPFQEITDNFGRAIYDLTANIPGDYTISAEVEGVSLPQKVSVSFR